MQDGDQLSCGERNAEWLKKIESIQEAGYMFVLKEDDSGLRLAGVSANITGADWWTHENSAEDLVGNEIADVFSDDCVGDVISLIKQHSDVGGSAGDHNALVSAKFCPFTGIGDELLCCSVALSNKGVYLLEVEERRGSQCACPDEVPGLFHVAQIMQCFTPKATPEMFTAAVSDSLMKILPGYDRVMVYRFSVDNSGEVIHEAIRPGCEVSSSYLNLRFPAGDIPDAARKLLVMNRTRFIADIHMKGAELKVHLDLDSDEKFDLSMSALRAPARCHLHYLQNMGVRSSLAAAITVDNELWGMFSFHGYTRPVNPTIEERTLVEMAASVTGMTLARYTRETTATTSLSLNRVLAKLTKYIRIQDFLSGEHKALLDILEADTIVLCEQSRSTTVYGNNDFSLSLAECVGMLHDDRSGRTLSFQGDDEKGIAYFSVRSFLVAFVRVGAVHRIAWAGNPDPPMIDERELHPRASFEKFVKTAPVPFPPWSPQTKELLGIVRHGIASHMYAEALPADLEETFAHVSHELRTPFHGVMGSLDMLREGLDSMGREERRDVIMSAIACGNSMLSTLKDILDIAKDRNNTEMSYTTFAAPNPILQTMSAMKQFGAQKSIDLVKNIDPALEQLSVVGDERRIKHIVQNFVNNAIKFTAEGGKVVVSLLVFGSLGEARTWWTEESTRFECQCWKGCVDEAEGADESQEESVKNQTRWLMYSVEDTGVGVSRGDIQFLTSAYRQLSHGASKAYAGTGLGLHISNAHIRTMSGGLGIASTSCNHDERSTDHGTIFACVIPLCLGTALSSGSTRDVTVADAARLVSQKVKFLVVDDNKVNVKILRHRITKAFNDDGNVEVVPAADGHLALSAWESIMQEVAEGNGSVLAGIFMDFHMPNMDGTECTAKIRGIETSHGWSRTPIVGCTADPTDRATKLFNEAGGDEVLFKPWKPEEVESMCRNMVETALTNAEK